MTISVQKSVVGGPEEREREREREKRKPGTSEDDGGVKMTRGK